MNTRTLRLLVLCCIPPLLFPHTTLAQLGGDQSTNDIFGRVQFIHSMSETGPLDVYLDDARWLDDFDFRAATPFTPIANGAHKIDIVAGGDSLNLTPLWTGILSVEKEKRYVLAALGRPGEERLLLRKNVRAESLSGNPEFFIIHGALDTGPLDIRLRDPAKGNEVVSLVHNNIPYGTSGIYYGLLPDAYNFEVTTSDNRHVIDVFHFNLTNVGEQAFVFVASGTGTTSSEGFAMIGYDHTGTPILPTITTATDEAAETPRAFTLEQNYPNPFNPATQIRYTLSKNAPVHLAVYDVLGRTVQTLVEAQQPAGTHTVQWDGRSDAGLAMPSGVYLYRLSTGTVTETRRMLLVK